MLGLEKSLQAKLSEYPCPHAVFFCVGLILLLEGTYVRAHTYVGNAHGPGDMATSDRDATSSI